jgi:hypothetical protein
MQAGRPIAPELDLDWCKAVAAPIIGSRHLAGSEPPLVRFYRRFEIAAGGERP